MSTDKKDKNPNVPTLRFPGFTDEWQSVTLGDVCDSFEYGMNAPSKDFDGNNKYIRITDIDESSHKYSEESVVSPDGDLSDRYLVSKGDILFARTGASVGKSYLYDSSDGKLYYAGFLIRAHVKDSFNDKFIFTQTLTEKYNKWVKIMSARSGQPGINSQEFATYPVQITSIEEQTKIASFISLLDERIATQSKIIEDLEKLMSAISTKILNKAEWTEYKICNIATIGRGRVISQTELNRQQSPTYPVYSSQTSNEGVMGYMDSYDYDGEYITWTTDGANAGTVFYRNGKFCCTNVCGILKVAPNFDTYFVSKALQRATIKYVSSNLANPKLMNNTMAAIGIKTPKYSEQKLIGTSLSLLREKITIELCKIELYRQQKQYLLSKMFI